MVIFIAHVYNTYGKLREYMEHVKCNKHNKPQNTIHKSLIANVLIQHVVKDVARIILNMLCICLQCNCLILSRIDGEYPYQCRCFYWPTNTYKNYQQHLSNIHQQSVQMNPSLKPFTTLYNTVVATTQERVIIGMVKNVPQPSLNCPVVKYVAIF